MPILVQKYGGSSVASPEKIEAVADQVASARRAGHDVVVVVSAMGKTTDELLRLAERMAGPSGAPRRELDMLVSTGERVTTALLCIALSARGCDAISFTGSQSGILTNDRHFDARIIEVRPHRIEDELARGKVVIVAGYQGMSYRRDITTLGRGGSDTTAVALAAALGAERCEIYSDVDGVYSADPKVVPGAQHLPNLDYQTLQEMAESGAKVLNAQAVEWARKHGVALYARRTGDAAPEPKETRVHFTTKVRARAVIGTGAVAVLQLADATQWPLLLLALERLGAQPTELVRAGESWRVVFTLANLPDWNACKAHLSHVGPIREREVLVSLVGDGLTNASVLPSVLAAAEEVAPSAQLLSATALRVCWTVQKEEGDALQRRLHEHFVEL